ncbi:response regulator [Thiocystis violascens]|uniref:Response regulator containing a CheY-like receiver domain and an HTH DNA-binding domain n=1 Tax=Thiocystis violascens (strain ATCC 17096 / DSM 198 / 6111) TaxID=765911 RepID=I3YBN9_THIV6|nr:response regulator transcription factor [Thiocystis violascens]AFL74407.1 response regulator containing a CheY-like receiver domain and an HTH DNA-binding domain [Thiocystis violascens DSM 198]
MRVLMIDDHALFRFGLQELLERRGIEVIAVGDASAGLQRVAETAPDVVLLDMRMPQLSGLELLRQLRAAHQRMPIAMLTTSAEERDVIDSLQSGAQGYLLKDMEPDALIAALGEIVRGRTVVAPELAIVLARAVQSEARVAQTDSGIADLTPREQEILCHLAEGQSNKSIARRLGISDGTVKLHVKAILRKLDVHSRVEAAVIAVERGLCERVPGREG